MLNKDQVTVCYTSTNQVLTSYIEKRESKVKFASGRVELHVRLGNLGATMAWTVRETVSSTCR